MTTEYQNEILDGAATGIENHVEPQSIISLNKFIVLSIITFGLYEVWWTYKAWRFFKQKDNLDISPAGRTLFSIFFLNSLFHRILNYAKAQGYNKDFEPTLLFIVYIILNLVTYLPDPFWLISVGSVVVLIPPFLALNDAKLKTPNLVVTEQNYFSGRQILLVVVGAILWVFMLMDMASPETDTTSNLFR